MKKEYVMKENNATVAIATEEMVESFGGLQLFKEFQKQFYNREVYEVINGEEEKEKKI